MSLLWCAECARWKRDCRGVSSDPGWDGRDGGCGLCTDRLPAQTTLEVWS